MGSQEDESGGGLAPAYVQSTAAVVPGFRQLVLRLYLGLQHHGFPCLHSPFPRFHSCGLQLLTGHSGILNIPSPQLPSRFILTRPASLLWRPKLWISEWGLSCPSSLPWTSNCIPAPSSPTVLTRGERNYDVGNRKLLAVKMALEEWRHWLEGAERPFIVWTDHKNLEYLRTAEHLNSRQARWALLFTRFNCSLSYRPAI